MDQPRGIPELQGVLETVLYYRNQERAEAFYSDVLGFRLLSRNPGRSLFYRAGESVLLLFDPAQTRRGGALPPHGAEPGGHVCFRVPPATYEAWKRRLADLGVEVLHEASWPGGGRSFYFQDPEGNLLEIADRDFWPR